MVEEVHGEGVSKGMYKGALGDLGSDDGRYEVPSGGSRRHADGANRQLLRAIERQRRNDEDIREGRQLTGAVARRQLRIGALDSGVP